MAGAQIPQSGADQDLKGEGHLIFSLWAWSWMGAALCENAKLIPIKLAESKHSFTLWERLRKYELHCHESGESHEMHYISNIRKESLFLFCSLFMWPVDIRIQEANLINSLIAVLHRPLGLIFLQLSRRTLLSKSKRKCPGTGWPKATWLHRDILPRGV